MLIKITNKMVIVVIINFFKTKGLVGLVIQQNCKVSLKVISETEKKNRKKNNNSIYNNYSNQNSNKNRNSNSSQYIQQHNYHTNNLRYDSPEEMALRT